MLLSCGAHIVQHVCHSGTLSALLCDVQGYARWATAIVSGLSSVMQAYFCGPVTWSINNSSLAVDLQNEKRKEKKINAEHDK